MANELVLEGGVWKLKEEAPAITNASIDPDYLPSTTRTLASGSVTIPVVLKNITTNPSVIELGFSGSYLMGVSPDSGSTRQTPTYGIDPDINVPSSGSIRTIYLKRTTPILSGSQLTETVYFSGSSGAFTSRDFIIEGDRDASGNITSADFGSSSHPISTATSDHKVLRVNPAGGTRYYNSLPNSTFAFSPTQPFTFALWYKSTQSLSGNGGIISSGITSSPYKNVMFWASGNDKVYLLLRASHPSSQLFVTSGAFSTSHQDGNWHHIAVTYDGSNTPGGIVFYHNGSVVTGNTINSDTLSSTDTLSVLNDSNYTFTIGPRYNDTSFYIDYEIADFVMYDAAATAATIASLWNSGNGTFADLIAPTAVGGGTVSEVFYYNFLNTMPYVGWDISSNNLSLEKK